MKGFFLFVGEPHEPVIPDADNFPEDLRGSVSKMSLNNSVSFVSWGTPPGDVHFSSNPGCSFLVLSGYISGARFLPDLSSQHQVCNHLIRILDDDHSLDTCATIAEQIHGSFSIVYVRLLDKNIYCITDRISSRPIWRKRTPNGWIVSSNANTIAFAGSDSQYDLGALGAFLLYGGPVEPTKSMYKGIFGIAEGTVLVLASGGTSEQHHWYRYKHEPDENRSYNAWLDLASGRLKRAAERILNTCSEPMVFLSGGIDSRLTAAALRAVGGNPMLVTLGEHNNLEIKIAKRAALALGLKHEIIIRDPHWYLRSLPNVVYEAGASFLWTHGHFSEAYRKCQEAFGVDAALLGDFCEAFSKLLCVVDENRKKMWTPQQFLDEFDRLPLPLYRPLHRDYSLRLLKPEVRHEAEEQLRRDILARYSLIRNVSGDPKIVADYFYRWQAVATIPTFLMFLDARSAGPERAIMFDKDVHELLQILPSSMRDGANFGSRLIGRLWPPAAKVVNSNSLLPLRWPPSAHAVTKSLKPVLGRLRRFCLDNSYRTTGSWPKKELLYLNDSAWRNRFEKILCEGSLFDDTIFDLTAIHDCWTRFCKGEPHLAFDIERLVQIGVVNLYRRKENRLLNDIFNFSAYSSYTPVGSRNS